MSDQPGEEQGGSVSGAERRGVPASRSAAETNSLGRTVFHMRLAPVSGHFSGMSQANRRTEYFTYLSSSCGFTKLNPDMF